MARYSITFGFQSVGLYAGYYNTSNIDNNDYAGFSAFGDSVGLDLGATDTLIGSVAKVGGETRPTVPVPLDATCIQTEDGPAPLEPGMAALQRPRPTADGDGLCAVADVAIQAGRDEGAMRGSLLNDIMSHIVSRSSNARPAGALP